MEWGDTTFHEFLFISERYTALTEVGILNTGIPVYRYGILEVYQLITKGE